ncbi:MAG: hypothetical protein R2795_10460 [Saprospiraceae bacterium]
MTTTTLYQIAGDASGGLIPGPLISQFVVGGETKDVIPTPTSLEGNLDQHHGF